MSWDEDKVDHYMDETLAKLQQANTKLRDQHGVGQFQRWDLDQESRQLAFSGGEQESVTFKVHAIGSLGQGVWKWAWANPTLVDAISAKSSELQKMHETLGLEVFENKHFKCDPELSEQTMAIALEELGGLGSYVADAGNDVKLYLLLESL